MQVLANPYFKIIAAAILWGSAGAFVKVLHLSAFDLGFFRSVVPFGILAAYFAAKRINVIKKLEWTMATASVLNVFRIGLYFYGFLLTTITTASILLYTWPVFVNVFAAFTLKERFNWKYYALLSVAAVGIVLVFLGSGGQTHFHLYGMVAILGCAIANGVMMTLFKRRADHYSNLESVLFQNMAATLAFLPFFLHDFGNLHVFQWVFGTIYSFLVGFVAFALYFSGLKQVPASVAAFLSYFEVLSATLMGIAFFGERLTLPMVLGAILIVGATILMKRVIPTPLTRPAMAKLEGA
jgi:DME family drug/metabolite transporter